MQSITPSAHGQALSIVLIVVRYEPEHDTAAYLDDIGTETRHVRVLALRPDGTSSILLNPPGDVGLIE